MNLFRPIKLYCFSVQILDYFVKKYLKRFMCDFEQVGEYSLLSFRIDTLQKAIERNLDWILFISYILLVI